MPPVIIPATFALAAPVVATTLAGWLSQDGWDDYVNAAITGVVVLAVAVAVVFLGGVQFTSNVWLNIGIVFAYSNGLLYGPLRPLHKFLILGPPGAIGTVAPAVRAAKAAGVTPDDPGQPARLPIGVVPAPTLRRHKPPEPPTTP